MSTALQHGHLGSGDRTIAQTIQNSDLESASVMSAEGNVLNATPRIILLKTKTTTKPGISQGLGFCELAFPDFVLKERAFIPSKEI